MFESDSDESIDAASSPEPSPDENPDTAMDEEMGSLPTSQSEPNENVSHDAAEESLTVDSAHAENLSDDTERDFESERTQESESEPADDATPQTTQRNSIVDLSRLGSVSQRRDQANAKPRLTQIVASTLNRIEYLFVEPKSCKAFRDLLRVGDAFHPDKRIFLIDGLPKTGRFTCAVRLALWLTEQRRHRTCFSYEPRHLFLDEIIEQPDAFQEQSVFIIRDAFQKSVSIDSLGGEYLDIVNQRLEKNDSYLIMTTVDTDNRVLQTLAGYLHPLQIEADHEAEFIQQVISNHLKFYRQGDGTATNDLLWDTLGEVIQDTNNELSKELRNPVQVSVFFLRLSQSGLTNIDDGDPRRLLMELSHEVTRNDRRIVRSWFRQLSINAKLYAMLISLFQGLDADIVHELYRESLSELLPLRIEGLHDDRQDGLEQLFEELHVIEANDAGSLEFTPSAFGQEVDFQIESYRHLLWTVMASTGFHWINRFREREFWELRRSLGRALGRLGIHDWEKLRILLTSLASHSHGAIASVPGYALQVIIERGGPSGDPERLPRIGELLSEWVESGNPNLMWASAACCWRFHDALAETADHAQEAIEKQSLQSQSAIKAAKETLEHCESLLAKLAKRFNQFDSAALKDLQSELPSKVTIDSLRSQAASDNFDSVQRAICEIYRLHPSRAVDLICDWIGALDNQVDQDTVADDSESNSLTGQNDDDDPDRRHLQAQETDFAERIILQQFGAAIGQKLLENHKDPLLLRESYAPLLRLIRPVLHLAADRYNAENELADSYGTYQQVVDSLLDVLRHWLQNSRWTERVFRELLQAINRSTQHQRRRITRTLINEWLPDEDPGLRHIAETLLARALIIDGVPVDLPNAEAGIILLETTSTARRNRILSDSGLPLYHRFRTQADIYVGQLGMNQWIVEPTADFDEKKFVHTESRLPLTVPLLETKDPGDIHFLLIIACQTPWDIEDIQSVHPDWLQRTIGRIANPKLSADGLEEIGFIAKHFRAFNRLLHEKERENICYSVDQRIATVLAARGSSKWWSLLSPYLANADPADLQSVCNQIQELSDRLDDIPDPDDQVDTARLVGCALQWLNAVSPHSLVELLKRWIQLDEDAPQVPMGRSYTRMLFRIMGLYPQKNGLSEQPQETSQRKTDIWGVPVDSEDLSIATMEPEPASDDESAFFPSVETHSPLLSLAPLVAAKDDWQCVKAILHWVRRWCHDPAWAQHFRQSLELREMIENCPSTWRSHLATYLTDFTKARSGWGEESVPEQAERIGNSLLVHLLLGPRKAIPELKEDEELLVIIVDSHVMKLAKIATGLFRYYRRSAPVGSRYAKKIRPILFRLGQNDPVAVASDPIAFDSLHLPDAPRFAPTILPILDRLPRDQIRRLVLLSNTPVMDLEDCQQDWTADGSFYCDHAKKNIHWAPSWDTISPDRHDKKALKNIIEHLNGILEGEIND
ncbi:hypothetical protein [Stieleria varia]|uniref:Uncharacterized protein n=1 Tax=Stieleria varia TaxID=2528005 RepID=A0A5C6AXM6_9BACT|nr:hypothetical protein [Stieleria varia]TWU04378.1 hypothetical protein Pla52n_24180 [Stieleria varia]